MLEKMVLMTIIYSAFFIFDVPKLKKQSRVAVLTYASILLFTFYLSSIYILELKWPILQDVVEAILGEPSRRIVDFLNVTP